MRLTQRRMAYSFIIFALLLISLPTAGSAQIWGKVWESPTPYQIIESDKLLIDAGYMPNDEGPVPSWSRITSASVSIDGHKQYVPHTYYEAHGIVSLAETTSGIKELRLELRFMSGQIYNEVRYISYQPKPAKPQLQFIPIMSKVKERRDGSMNLTVTRTNSIGVATVNYSTVSRSARAGQDFIPIQGQLTFKEGENSKILTIRLIQDNIIEPLEAFGVQLFNPSDNVVLSENSYTTIVIEDDSVLDSDG
ncbi:hypothetical protein GK047_27960 [Paenibacillus sp. SYP-B3998]|uniref:Calx-beta domain-containing protein n=1 Tax=Paenibacillus sp. SYP-B3998 TaxID=2678564 RepID=A0A6G4A7G6_9BACL|nr:Calx-beta domain-containing protein [Paenibacillus sp. SYP-B3998]NEW09761.1 hypothetical protein [Paenibacillus sp. SYP-B3998]